MRWPRLFLAAGLAALVVACEPGTFCTQCTSTEACKRCPPPEPTKIDWTGLSEELKKLEFDGDVTINVQAGELVLKPGQDAWKVRIANWKELGDELQKMEKANAEEAKHYALVYQLHAMLAERKPPTTYNYWIWGPPPVAGTAPHPPFKLCPSALPVFVFFPREAEFSSWAEGHYESCASEPRKSNPVCPNGQLYGDHIDRFVESLVNCTDQVTTLRVQGFASSSGLGAIAEEHMKDMREAFNSRFESPGPCDGRVADAGSEECLTPMPNRQTQMFNLLVAESRARNVKKMLEAAAGEVKVESHVWCSYCDMVKARKVMDTVGEEYDGFEGMLNRRAEIGVAH